MTDFVMVPREHVTTITFALYRFIWDARHRANEAAQDKEGRFFKPGDAERYLADAEKAESARTALIAAAPAAPQAEPVAEVVEVPSEYGKATAVNLWVESLPAGTKLYTAPTAQPTAPQPTPEQVRKACARVLQSAEAMELDLPTIAAVIRAMDLTKIGGE